MRHSSGKKTPNPREQNVSSSKKSESQKKLVQARLPFKLVADSTTPTTSEGETLNQTIASNPATPTSIDIRKRKLSYSESSNSGSKENLDIVSKKSKGFVTIISDTSDIESADSDLEISPTNSTQKTKEKPQSSDKRKSGAKSNSVLTKKVNTPKLKIKLPTNKKKRRKSNHKSGNRNNENITESSDDVEVVGSEMNPQKRAKIDIGNKGKEESVENVNIEKVETSTEIVEDRKESRKSLRQIDSKRNKNGENDESKLAVSKSPSVANDEEKVTEIVSIESDSNDGTLKAEKKKKVQVTPKSKLKTLDAFISKGTKSHAEASNSKPERKAGKITSKNKNDSVDERCKTDNETDINDDDNIELSSSSEPDTSTANFVEKPQQQPSEKRLTPKQQKLYEQRQRAREEKELKLQKIKEERELKLQQEKLQRQREKEERELARKREREEKEEQRRREKEEKEEARRKEREDKERKRVAEIEAKNEEKRKKDEAKEEERRRKELEKEEMENKKKKAAEAFTKFFVAPKVHRSATNDDDRESKEDVERFDCLAFRPFQIKGDMTMAPHIRKNFTQNAKENLDLLLKKSASTSGVADPSQNQLYLTELKTGSVLPVRWRRKTIDDSDEGEEVVIIEDSLERAGQAIVQTAHQQRYRVKFFSFHENKRPPYYGTWRKKTSVITPRNPFVQDKTFFDYDVDSDDEWEEEEPGESLNGSEDEKEIESEDDDYEVDNEWFVPHGHLSDEEIQNEDEHKDTSRKAQQAKLIVLQQEFAQEMKKKTEKIKPRLLGCIWQDENGNQPELCPNVIWNSLNIRAMMFTSPPLVEEPEVTEPEASSPQQEKMKRLELDENLTKDLVRLVHGNRHSKAFLINEYLAHIEKTNETVKSGEVLIPHKSTVRDKIDEISAWQVIEGHLKKKKKKKKLCWIVNDEVLKKHTLDELSHLNGWSYTLQPKYLDTAAENPTDPEPATNLPENSTITLEVPSEALASTKKLDDAKKKKKFTKLNFVARVTTEESASENETKSTSVTDKPFSSQSPAQTEVVRKKRIPLLMSGPRGQQFSPSTKNALISQFLKKDEKPEKKIDSSNSETTAEVVILD